MVKYYNNTASAVSSALQITGNGAKLVGVTVEGSSAPDGAAIKIEGNNANVADCEFKNNAATGTGGSMLTVDGNGTNLEKVNLTGNKGQGITLNGDNATIKDNNISGNNGAAITINGKTTKVEGTTVSGNNGTAVIINGDGATFTDNTVSDNNGTAMIVNGNDAVVEKTNLTGNNGAGIVINGNGTNATGNTVSGNNGSAMVLNGDDIAVKENTLENNDGGIVIGENSNMNTPEKKAEISEVNGGAEVLEDNSLKVIVNPDVKHVDENIIISIHMAVGAGNATITFNNKTYKFSTDGTINLGYLPIGDYKVTVEFAENQGFTPYSTEIISFNVQNWNLTELQKLINNPSEEGIVDLGNHTFIRHEGESPVIIPSDVVVNGEGSVIEANGSENILIINGNNVSVNDLTINNINGTGIHGSGDNIKINGVKINDSNGTAINITGKNTKISNVELNQVNGNGINVKGDNAQVKDITSSNGHGDAVTVTGDNANVSDVSLNNHEGTGVYTNGSNASVGGVTATGGSGTIVKATGSNATISDVKSEYRDSKDAIDAPSDAKVETVTVIKYDTSITAKATSYVINYGGKYSVVLNSKVAGKTITLTINGKKLSAVTNADGVATFTLTKTLLKSAGVKTVNIAFAGDEVYNESHTTAKLTVNKESTKITAKSVKKTYKKSKAKKIKITLKNSKNKSLGKVKVTLKVNKKLKGKIGKKLKKGKVFTVKFNKKGIGYITLKTKQVKGFKKGTYKFTVTYKGSGVYKTVTKKNIKMKIK